MTKIWCRNSLFAYGKEYFYNTRDLYEEEECHEVVVGVPAAGLDHVHVLAAHRVVDLNLALS